MLSGVTLIAHGFGSNVDGWVTAMADAILARPDLDVDQPRYTLSVTDPGHDDGPLSVVETSHSGPSPTNPDTEAPEIVILLDWSDVAGALVGGYSRSTADVAAAVADALLTPNLLANLPTPVAELPLHLIGHSRGASLVGRLARDLGQHGIWVDQVTTLDPHPVDGVRDPLSMDYGDAPMEGWANVVFWDNYWRTDGDMSFDFTGEPIANTYDVQFDESVLEAGGYTFGVFPPSPGEHSDVHLWYYGTIDTSTNPPANNGDHDVPGNWYGDPHPARAASGYHFSRAVGGARSSEGLSHAVGGDAQRSAIDFSGAAWPSLLDLQIDTDDLEFIAGEPIPVTYFHQDFDSDATVGFYLDTDRNPYNGDEVWIDERLASQTGPVLASSRWDISTSAAQSGLTQAGDYYMFGRIGDSNGHARYAYAAEPVTLEKPPAEVIDRHVFYNNCVWDKGNAGANADDDLAVAPDKQALLPGSAATFANYTSFSGGINGVMVDIADLTGTPTTADFEFRMGNTDDPTTWAQGPDPTAVAVRAGHGTGGSDRVTLVWPDRAIQKQWLQVTVLPTENTGLSEADVFYFGNAVGETGGSTIDAKVNAFDMLGARNNWRSFVDPAAIDFRYDFNRDARVNAFDMLLARNSQTHFLNALRLISPPVDQIAVAECMSRRPAFTDDSAARRAADVVLMLHCDSIDSWIVTRE